MRLAPIPAGVASGLSPASLMGCASRFVNKASEPPRFSDRFIYPLFLYCYKPLFQQALWIHIYTKHPGVSPSVASVYPEPRRVLPTQRFLCGAFSCNSFVIRNLRALVFSCRSFSQLSPLFSIVCGLFSKIRGGGVPLLWSRSPYARIFPAATWTRHAHPTIIPASSTVQVHG
jgi:hypothetical protein